MLRKSNVFSYTLGSLLRMRSHKLSMLRIEQSALISAVESLRNDYAKISHKVDTAEEDLRLALSQSALISATHLATIGMFLKETRNLASRKMIELQKAEEAETALLARIIKAQQSVKTLEKHKAREKSKFDLSLQRSGIKENDNLWLTRLHDK